MVHFMYNVMFSLFSYICVISGCIFCAMMKENSRSWLFTQLGLLGTIGADFFLVLLPVQQRVPGMVFFCFTQIFYFLRIYHEDKNAKRKRIHLIVRAIASAGALIVTPAVLGSRLDAVAVLSVFYYGNLFCNLVFAFCNFKESKLFAFALLAFILSDTLLGFLSLSDYFLIARGSLIYRIVRIGKNIFYPLYIVSQVSIPISIVSKKIKTTSTARL